jgi:hypothetical protein
MELFFLYCIKHTVADLALQRYFVSRSVKQFYLNRAAQLHYLHHSILTFLVSLFFVDLHFAILLGLLDHIAHWHIDFVKSYVKHKYNIVESKREFWLLQTLDQSLHITTYYCLFLLVATA